MKIWVYTIARDEAANAAAWAACAADADGRVVLDTGSVDGTPALLAAAGVRVERVGVQPWRFDAARNAALDLVPADADVCISLDMDERLAAGWRAALEQAWRPGARVLRYPFVWSWSRGRPGLVYPAARIHSRFGARWVRPYHEYLAPEASAAEEAWSDTLRIEHRQDPSKARAHHLAVLEQAAREHPQDERYAHVAARTLMYMGRHEAALAPLEAHARRPDADPARRAQSLLHLGRCCAALGRDDEARAWYAAAAGAAHALDPAAGWRDPPMELARLNVARGLAGPAWQAAARAMAMRRHPRALERWDPWWGAEGHELAAVAAHLAGDAAAARHHAETALALAPADWRIAGVHREICGSGA